MLFCRVGGGEAVMSLSTWGSQTDVRPTQSPSTASTRGGGGEEWGGALTRSCRERGLRRMVGRTGWGGGVGGPLVTVRHLKVISALPYPCITY